MKKSERLMQEAVKARIEFYLQIEEIVKMESIMESIPEIYIIEESDSETMILETII